MNFIQFLGRDKDDGGRRSAVSGKKVGHSICGSKYFLLIVIHEFQFDL